MCKGRGYKRDGRLFFLGVCLWVSGIAFVCPLQAYAQPPAESPHEGAAVDTGVITGRLLKDGKTPLGDHMAAIEIFRGRELVLTIPKKTQADGSYLFKNIFPSTDFSYSIMTQDEGGVYRTERVSLKEGQKELVLDLNVVAGSEQSPQMPAVPQSGAEGYGGEEHEHGGEHAHAKPLIDEYQVLAIILSLAAVGYAIYLKKKKA